MALHKRSVDTVTVRRSACDDCEHRFGRFGEIILPQDIVEIIPGSAVLNDDDGKKQKPPVGWLCQY